jgi:hypothetical protein
MNAQQYDEVYLFKSFKIIAAVKPVIVSAQGQGSILLNTPLTASETFSGAISDVFSLETVAGVSNVKVSILLVKQAIFDTKLALAVHSNPITLTLPDLSVCSATGCAFAMVLQSVVSVAYKNSSSTAPSFVTHCDFKNKPFNTTYSCPDNLSVTAFCDGLSSGQEITSRCPYLITKPNCGRLLSSTSSVSDDICTMESYTSMQTTCQCQVPIPLIIDGSRRRLNTVSSRQLLSSGQLQMGTITSRQIVTNALPLSPPLFPPTPTPTVTAILPPTIFVVTSINVGGFSTTNVIILSAVFSVLGSAFIAGIVIYFYIISKKKSQMYVVNEMNRNEMSIDEYERSVLEDSPHDVHTLVGDNERYIRICPVRTFYIKSDSICIYTRI